MYIIKNALRCISRSAGRNILIGIIALVIAVSSCIGLSIRQAAESAKATTLEGMSITSTISYDRASAMGQISGGRPGSNPGGSFDKDAFIDMMGGASSFTLEDYLKYAEANSVQDFYYTLTAYFNGSESFAPVSDEDEDDDSSSSSGGSQSSMFPGMGMGGMGMGDFGSMFASGDFSLVGYSSYNAMTAFINGTATILDGGQMFEDGASEYTCVISEELALFNSLNVGDTVVITNPAADSETYTLTISGIYSSTANNDFSMSMFGKSQDPANQIYVSAAALQAIVDASETANADSDDDIAISGSLSATYVMADTDAYYAFEEEVRALGLDDSYTVSSSDISAFENSLTPLKTLSTMAGWFLLVILAIGAVILVVLNIFNVRERKYEVGVLTAMGMKKHKVATQFVCEILIVTMIAVIIGACIGAVSSVPVTNALLANQITSQQNQQTQMGENFGRPDMFGGGGMPGMPSDLPDNLGSGNPFGDMFGGAKNYLTQVDSAMNLTVVLQMIGVGLLLTLIASAASVLFIMRYDPLKILANRD